MKMTQNEKVILVGAIFIGVMIYFKKDKLLEEFIMLKNSITSRGIKNNNPGNIRKSEEQWQGLAEKQSDKSFFVFATPEYGIRALAKVLINYAKNHGADTIKEIITRYAPATDGNNVDAYIKHVCKITGKDADEVLVYPRDLPNLVYAIILHENGGNPYTTDQIYAGIGLAAA